MNYHVEYSMRVKALKEKNLIAMHQTLKRGLLSPWVCLGPKNLRSLDDPAFIHASHTTITHKPTVVGG